MCYCEYPDYYVSTKRKARKVHRCNECLQPIKKGEYYLCDRAVMDGDWYGSKYCLNCEELLLFLKERLDCFCPDMGGLMQEIRDSDLQDEDYLIPLRVLPSGALAETDTSVEEEDGNYDEVLHNAFYADFYRLRKPVKAVA